MLAGKNILLIISGGIAAYKTLELIRLIKKNNGQVRTILTKGGEQFVTPLSIAALSENNVYTDLWSLKDETEMGHIRLSRESDLIVVAPASANIIARMVTGIADDLATTTLLAATCPIMVFPAMNPIMYENQATKNNIDTLRNREIIIVAPCSGEMACGEYGTGRLPEAVDMLTAINDFFAPKPLSGLTALVTSGPTFEAIDPVRFLGNRSSGKQGYTIAEQLTRLGAKVTYITGPSNLPSPSGCHTIRIESAAQMHDAVMSSLPVNIGVFAAAVSDWRPEEPSLSKLKKQNNAPTLALTETTDILKTVSKLQSNRPELVVGFAAETDDVVENAKAKLARKGCDWLVVNPVGPQNPVFGAEENQVYFLTSQHMEELPTMTKADVAEYLCDRITRHFK